MDNKLEMIETVSKLYRDNLKYAEDLRREKNKIKEKIKDTTITHVDYVKFERRLKYLENNHSAQLNKIDGISLAREALLDLLNKYMEGK